MKLSDGKSWLRTLAAVSLLVAFGTVAVLAFPLCSLSGPSSVAHYNTPSSRKEGTTKSKPVQLGVLNLKALKQKSKGIRSHRLPWFSARVATSHAGTSAAGRFGCLPTSPLILSVSFPGQMVFRSPPFLA